MKKLILILSLAALLPVSASWAQVAPPNEAGVTWAHLHFNVRNMEANHNFWIAFGGTFLRNAGKNEIFKLPGTFIVLSPTEPSAGSGIVRSPRTAA